jgi:type I restriction enzyme, S subunit
MSGLPKGWATTNLGAVGEVYCGQSSTAADVNGEGRGTPYVTGPEQWTGSEIELNKWTNTPKRIVPEGCIFITVKGAGVGKMFPGIACAIGRDVYAYEPSKQLLYPFVMRALANTVNAVIREARGDIPGLSKEHITDHTVPLPPLAEQRRIVAKLDAMNAKSARARTELARIETLVSRYKQAVLSKAFSGELTREWRRPNQSVPLGSNAQTGFNLDDSERGVWSFNTLPEQWAWRHFDEVFIDITDGKRKLPQKEYLPAGPYPVVDQGVSKVGGYTDQHELLHPAEAPYIVFGDHTRFVKYIEERFVQGADGVKVLHSAADVSLTFAFLALSAVELPNKGYSRHMKFVRSTIFPVAPLEEQHEIVRRIESAFAKIDRLAKEAKRALALVGRLDEAILAKAFRGELVPQDENDEPAELLLARIRAERETAPKVKRGRKAAI